MKKHLFLLLTSFLYTLSSFAANVTVYFDASASNWEKVCVYTWSSRGQTPHGDWPGMELTEKVMFQGKNVYKVTADDQNQIIFNNSHSGVDKGNQTLDLPVRANYIYNWKSTPDEVRNGVVINPSITPTGTLPVLYIYCDDNEIMSKDLADKNYRDATYWLDANGINGWKNIGTEDEPLPLEIKARGNYTRTGFAKKPFKIKLGKKQDFLGLTPEKSKHYALLAHADDYRGYLRNFIGFNLGRRMNEFLPWTPGMTPIELVINGDYRGLYFLTESIRVGDGRIDIVELDDNVADAKKVSGGYIVEFDNYSGDGQIVLNDQGRGDLMITPDTPEQYSDIQRRFVTEQFTVMNDLVHSHSDKLWSYLDLDAAAAYYVVNEIIDHWESFHGSTYLFRDFGNGQKWVFSPLWDCGNAFQRDAYYNQNYFTNGSAYGNNWINDLRKTPGFMEKVKEIWKWFWGTQVESLYDDVDAYVDAIRAAAVRDHERWGNAPKPNSSNATSVKDNSDMDGKAREVKAILQSKIEWLRTEWGQPDASAVVPTRDTTEPAPLPDYALPEESGILTAVGDECDDATDAAYYDLYGRRVLSPVPGSVLIRRTHSNSSLILHK